MSSNKAENAEEIWKDDCKTGKKSVFFWRQISASVCSQIATICVGISFSFTGSLLPLIRDYVNEEDGSWLATLNIFSMIFGTCLSWYMLRRSGNQKTLSLMCPVWVSGWFCLSIASNFATFLAGCIIVGFASGFCNNIVIDYMIEMPAPKLRAGITMFSTACSFLGVLLGHLVGMVVSWRLAMQLCALGPVLILASITWSPESFYWLLHKNRPEEATKNFFWLRGRCAESKKEFAEILSRRSKIEAEQKRGILKSMASREFFKPFSLSVLMFTAASASGIDIIIIYAVDIMRQLSPNLNAEIITVMADLICLVFCVLSCIVDRKVSHRFLFLSTAVGGILSLVGLISVQMYQLPSTFFIGFLSLYMAILSVGMVPLVWLVPAEIFPEAIRDVGIGAVTIYYYFITFVMAKFVPMMITGIGMVTVLWLFMVTTSICTISLYFVMPETKNTTLVEVEDQMFSKQNTDVKLAYMT